MAANTKDIIDFLFEAGQLKKVQRTGEYLLNLKEGDTVAHHSFRAAIIGYFLSKMEGADTEQVVLTCLFHDFTEARITDVHKVAQRYIDIEKAEMVSFKEQLSKLPKQLSEELYYLFDNYRTDRSIEGVVAKDAELLETAMQAKEYLEEGRKDAYDWIKNVKSILKTASAKKLLAQIEKTKSTDWWKGLKKIHR